MTKSYTLYTHSTETDNYCTAKWQVVEDSSNITIFEKIADTSTQEVAVKEFEDLMRLLQSQLVKGETMTLQLVELHNEVSH